MVDYLPSRQKMLIVEEIKRWSRDVLQQPSDFFNGLPPCPYAFDAWVNNRVKITFGGQDQTLKSFDYLDDDRTDLVIVVVSDWKHDEIEEWCNMQNKILVEKDLVLMPFVPGSGVGTGQPEEEMEDWEPLVEEEYAMVFIQRLSDVVAASENLENAGYYKNCTAEFLKYVKDRRERLDNARQEPLDAEEDGKEVVWIED
jgi:hypothetical protein